jgi:hypothetical protein
MGKHCNVFKGRVVGIDSADAAQIKDNSDRDFSYIQSVENGQIKRWAKDDPHAKAPPKPFNLNEYMVDITAYIDDDSQLPVMVVYGGPGKSVTRTYQFQSSTTSLAIPADVQKALNAHRQRQKQLSVPRAPI